VKQLAEAFNLPVITTYLHQDVFPCDHDLYCGPLGYLGNKAGMEMIHDADVVLALGTRLGPFGTNQQYEFDYWPKEAKILQVDINPRKLGLTKYADVMVNGDAKLVAEQLFNALFEMEGNHKDLEL
jgi:sulfoacetaldehyde acetyltransferase